MSVASVPFEFVIFAATLLALSLFHHQTLPIALTGLAAVVFYKLAVPGFKEAPGLTGLMGHVAHEAPLLINLFLLLTGFALLARHFESSRLPDEMPAFLPDNWTGGLWLLGLVFILSAFLDNIAAALIGGTVARHVFKNKVHTGYLAGIVAAANAGGAGSVIGDTTTTMMWIAGVPPTTLLRAYTAAFAAFLVFAIPAARQQHKHAPILKDRPKDMSMDAIDWWRLIIVMVILTAAVAVNVLGNAFAPTLMAQIPALGLTVWLALLITAFIRQPDWRAAWRAVQGALFLVSLVLTASLMPVESLPAAAWKTAFGLGLISAVFDNIPLTALALKQGGYDWGLLAYAVGFGGSMLWFGSSAGVAIAGMYPQAKSATSWLRAAWHVPLAYVAGFMVMLAVDGWRP